MNAQSVKAFIPVAPPEAFPTEDDLAEPLDEQSKAELLTHVDDDDVYEDDNSAYGYR